MGNLVCCQSPQNATQFRIEQIIAEDKLYYSNPDNKVKQRPFWKINSPRIQYHYSFWGFITLKRHLLNVFLLMFNLKILLNPFWLQR